MLPVRIYADDLVVQEFVYVARLSIEALAGSGGPGYIREDEAAILGNKYLRILELSVRHTVEKRS